jgi:hypothetical protein
MILAGAGVFILLLLLIVVFTVSKKAFIRNPAAGTLSAPTVATKPPIFFKEGWQWKLFRFVLLASALVFVFFYDWESTLPGKVLLPIMGEWFSWTIKAFAVIAGIVFIKTFFFPTKTGSNNSDSSELLLWLVIVVGLIGVVGVSSYTYISTPKSNNLIVDFQGVQFGTTKKVIMGIEDTVTTLYATRRFIRGEEAYQEWSCPKSLGIPLMFVLNDRNSFVLTEESKADLLRQHSLKVDVLVTSTSSPWHGRGVGSDNPCPYLKMN